MPKESFESILADQDVDSLFNKLFHLCAAYMDARALWVFAKLGIADLLAEGPRSCEELASRCGAQADPLHRLLRVLASDGVVSEVRPAIFELTKMGHLLRSDSPRAVRSWAIMTGGAIYTSFSNLLHSVTTGQPAFEETFGSPMYQYFQAHPDEAGTFSAAMAFYGQQAIAGLLRHFDFSGIRKIVDVGAGAGTLLIGLLQALPSTQGVLFDLPHVAKSTRATVEAAPLGGRCEVVGGDFFQAVPSGGDLYILSSILPSLNDEQGVTVLENCKAAMPPTGRLLLLEMVIPLAESPHISKLTDLVSLVALGGRVRTEQEYRALLERAGFKVSRITPMDFMKSILEAVPLGV